MGFYRLAKLAIKASFLLLALVLLYEIHEAYSLSQIQPFEIYTNPAFYHLHQSKYTSEEYSIHRLDEYRRGSFDDNEIFAYDYKGTKFLIKNLIGNLHSIAPPGVDCLVNDENFSVFERIEDQVEEDAFIIYYPHFSHWLSFLFEEDEVKLSLEEIVQEYIPNEKWVAKENPYFNHNNYTPSVSIPFMLNDDENAHDTYTTHFDSRLLQRVPLAGSKLCYRYPAVLAITYKNEKALIESKRPLNKDADFSFCITNASAPNNWVYQNIDGINFYYELEVNTPDVTVLHEDITYTINQIFENREYFKSSDREEISIHPLKNFD